MASFVFSSVWFFVCVLTLYLGGVVFLATSGKVKLAVNNVDSALNLPTRKRFHAQKLFSQEDFTIMPLLPEHRMPGSW